jgi:putative membrane protein
MNRTILVTGLTAAALAAGLTGAQVAGATPSSSTTTPSPSAQDRAFLESNDQVNLAEIGLGKWIDSHLASHHHNALALASMTRADHAMAEKTVRKLARADDVSLPSMPNAAQQKAAAQVKSADHVAYRYFVVQVAGHKQSIAATRTEIARGSDPAVVKYAKSYLPVAKKHLAMAEKDLTAWKQHHH